MSKHTPGPWTAVAPKGRPSSHTSIVEGPDGIMVLFAGSPARTDEEIIANARLSAAAPDLRAVAEQAINVLYEASGGKPEDLPESECELWNAARAAIAKAEGLDAGRGTGASESEPVK